MANSFELMKNCLKFTKDELYLLLKNAQREVLAFTTHLLHKDSGF